jgi:2-amino-4-hydroxy-6-hydroxymethyldihydropteridine diphosphokinase
VAKVYLGLGSNLGDRESNLRRALQLLPKAWITITKFSSIYETDPEGSASLEVQAHTTFLNAVCVAETELSPTALLRVIKEVEVLMGRVAGPRYSPRVIDIDILLFGDLIMDTPNLTIPHQAMVNRAFVLVPLVEIAPRAVHPRLEQSAQEILSKLPSAGGIRLWGTFNQDPFGTTEYPPALY